MELTESKRQNLLVTLTVLSLLCLFSSFLLFVLAVNIKITIDARLSLLESYDSSIIPAVFLVVGMLNLAQNSACTYVNFKLRQPEKRENMLLLMMVLLISGILLVIVEVSTAIASLVHISILSQEFGKGIRKGMAEYSVGEELKREIDYVQIFFKCCGDLSYTDWFHHFWSDKTVQPSEGSSVTNQPKLGEGVESLTDETPFSCCDWHSPRPCIHHNIHDNKRHHNYDHKKETTLYTKGCRDVLIGVYSGVLRNIGLIGFAIAAVQICILLLFRLLQTSLVLAGEAGNWTATTEAYLYFRTVIEDEEENALIDDDKETDKETSDEESKNEDKDDDDAITDDEQNDEKSDENKDEENDDDKVKKDQINVDDNAEVKNDDDNQNKYKGDGNDDDEEEKDDGHQNVTKRGHKYPIVNSQGRKRGNNHKSTVWNRSVNNARPNSNTNKRKRLGKKKYIALSSKEEIESERESDSLFSSDKYHDFFHKMKSAFYNNLAHSRNSTARQQDFPRYEYLELKKRNKGRNRSLNYRCVSDESDSSESLEERNAMAATLF